MEEPKLYASNDLAQWKSTFAAYTNVLEAKCSKKTKAKDSKDLKSLDKWCDTSVICHNLSLLNTGIKLSFRWCYRRENLCT